MSHTPRLIDNVTTKSRPEFASRMDVDSLVVCLICMANSPNLGTKHVADSHIAIGKCSSCRRVHPSIVLLKVSDQDSFYRSTDGQIEEKLSYNAKESLKILLGYKVAWDQRIVVRKDARQIGSLDLKSNEIWSDEPIPELPMFVHGWDEDHKYGTQVPPRRVDFSVAGPFSGTLIFDHVQLTGIAKWAIPGFNLANGQRFPVGKTSFSRMLTGQYGSIRPFIYPLTDGPTERPERHVFAFEGDWVFRRHCGSTYVDPFVPRRKPVSKLAKLESTIRDILSRYDADDPSGLHGAIEDAKRFLGVS